MSCTGAGLAATEHPVAGQDIHRGCGEQITGQEIAGGKGDCGEMVGYVDQAGIFPANPRTLFVGNFQSLRKS